MNSLTASVNAWLRAGAEVSTGLLLFSQYSTNTRLPVLVRLNPTRYRPLLIEKLCALAGVDVPQEPTVAPRRRFRDDFPFLRDADCPPELKILASDKITAHEQYMEAHAQLFDCTSLDECYRTARVAIDSFLENRAIFAELDYYKEHHAILGKHPIFAHLRQLRKLRDLDIVELIDEQRCLRGTIWRINDEIKKGTKPHLQGERERRLQQKQTLLTEVEKLITAYQHGATDKRQR